MTYGRKIGSVILACTYCVVGISQKGASSRRAGMMSRIIVRAVAPLPPGRFAPSPASNRAGLVRSYKRCTGRRSADRVLCRCSFGTPAVEVLVSAPGRVSPQVDVDRYLRMFATICPNRSRRHSQRCDPEPFPPTGDDQQRGSGNGNESALPWPPTLSCRWPTRLSTKCSTQW
jgi:hypothetical protein